MPRDLAGRQSIRLVPHKEPEGFEAARLGKGGKSENDGLIFHMSRNMEITCRSQGENGQAKNSVGYLTMPLMSWQASSGRAVPFSQAS